MENLSLIRKQIVYLHAQDKPNTMKNIIKTIRYFLISALLVCFFGNETLFAQTVYQLSVENVLQTNYVRSMVQDKYGYVWMATTSGLVRYDGYQTEMFCHAAQGNRRLMQDFRVLTVKMWNNRFVWVRLRGRLYSCYDIETNRFVDYTGNGTYNEPVFGYTFMSNGDMVLWNDDGCYRIHFDGESFSKTKLMLPKGKFLKYLQGDGEEYAVYADGKIYKKNSNRYTLVYSAYLQKEIRKVEVAVFYNDKIYIVSNGKVYEFNVSRRIMSLSEFSPAQPHVLKDNKGNLVIVSTNGNDVFYFTKKKTFHFTGVYSKQLLQVNTAPHYSFFTDSYGTLWITAYGNGVMSFNPKTSELRTYTELLPSPYTFCVMADKSNNVWVAVENMGISVMNFSKSNAVYLYSSDKIGINHVDDIRLLKRAGNKIYVANMQNGFFSFDQNLNSPQPINQYKDDVTTVAKDKSGMLCVGTRKSGVYVGNRNYIHNDELSSINKSKVSDILADKNGRMWVTLFDIGLDVQVGTTFRHVIEDKYLQLRNMEFDKNGNIWIASSQGVLVFNPDKLVKNNKAYKIVHVSKNDSINDEVHCVFCDSKGRIWIGSIGNGVMMIDGKKTSYYTTHDGLADNNVQSIVEDRTTGDIWFGTDNGLSRLHNGVFNNFYFGINSLANACTEDNALQLADGRLVFATHHGVLTFNPKDIKKELPHYLLAITKIEVNGASMGDIEKGVEFEGPLGRARCLTVDNNQNSLTFYFSDFYYEKKNSSSFTYWLEGYDKDWSSVSRINFAQYRNLPAGTYTLHVKSCNANGVWSPKEATLKIVVLPPFYATWWAYLIYIMLIATAAYYIYINFKRINNLRNAVKVENQLTEFKLRFFTNISHEFRTPLTIIQGDMERMKTIDKVPGEMKQPLASMAKSVERMMRLINQLLEFRKMQNNKLKLALEKTDVVAFLHDIFLNFRSIAEGKRINFQFLPFDKSFEMYADRSYLDKIAYNLLSNALKYTPSKGDVTFRISLSKNGSRLVLSVEDSGVGVEKQRQAQLFERFNRSTYSHDSIGIGLHLTAELVRVHHGEISYRDNVPHGSVFRVELPVDETVYEKSDFMSEDNIVAIEENNNKAEKQNNDTDYKAVSVAPMNPQTVLIAEDDNDVREFLQQELGIYFNVVVTADGQEAYEKIKENKPDLLISDVVMPRMDGYQLTKKVRSDNTLADIPVILLTALTADNKQQKGFDVGADVYIEKPFRVKLLVAQCSRLLEQRSNLKKAYANVSAPATMIPQPEIITEEQDRKFRELLDTWLANHLADSQLNIDGFAESMGYGRTTFYKKMKKVVGTTPNEYIRSLRMNKAAELLKDDRLTIAEVGYKVGIADPYYFSKMFKSFFGVSPSKYRNGK